MATVKYVPPALSQKLANSWGGVVNTPTYEDQGHAVLSQQNSSGQDIADYLRSKE